MGSQKQMTNIKVSSYWSTYLLTYLLTSRNWKKYQKIHLTPIPYGLLISTMYPKVCNVSKYLVHCALPPLPSMEAESSHNGVKAFMPSFLKTDPLTFFLDIFYYFQSIKLSIYLHSIFEILQFEISSLMKWIFFLSLNWIFLTFPACF